MPLLDGERQQRLHHSPQLHQQTQKDFPSLLMQILAGPSPLFFFFFVLMLQINIYHALKQQLDASAQE